MRVDDHGGMIRIAFVLLCMFGCGGGKGGGSVNPDGGGSGRVCGGKLATPCEADEFCDFGRNGCGFDDGTGICRARPSGCPDIFAPVCGCDGQTHSNECDANAAGTDVNASGGCPLPAGQFGCGFRQCAIDGTYCQRAGSDIGGEPDGFTCVAIPASCPSPATCACLQAANEPCASQCEGQGATGLTVTCLGG
jgi:hypothetical protein